MTDDSPGAATPPVPSPQMHLLGEPRWRLGAAEAQTLTPLDGALVAVLALDGPQARDVLAGRLWPRANARQAANNLRKHVSRLRGSTGHRLFHTGSTLSLADEVSIDLRSLASMGVAALLAAGDLLAGCDYADNEFLDAWVRERRERVRRVRAEALAGHAEALERQRELAAALQLGERIVELAPLHEHAWRRLMRLHYLRDDRTAAITAFERFEALLREHTGARPGAETQQLLDTVERSRPAPPSARAVVPVSLTRPPERIGREREWAAMARAWSAGRGFMLIGDAGIGKSRLLADHAHGRPGMLLDRGRPGDAQTPYAVLARLLHSAHAAFAPELDSAVRLELARIVPAFGPAPQAPAQQAALWHVAESLLRTAVAQGLAALLIDDLHFADLATLEALRWLSASPALSELRFGFAVRPLDGSATGTLLRDWLDDSHRPERIEPAALSAPDVHALIASLGLPEFSAPDVADRLFAHAGGHPLFTLETLKDAWLHGHDFGSAPLPNPATVQTLLDRRLSELPHDTLDLLRVAAVAGIDLTPERAAQLLNRSPLALAEDWVRLEKANVLSGQRFVHDLMHDSALRLVPAALGRVLHAALAGLLAGDAGVPPGRIAEHWEAAERWAEAGACWHAAGIAARLAGRLVEQHTLLEAAAACHRRAGDTVREFEALLAGIDGLMLRSGGAAALAALPRLQALAGTAQQQLKCRMVKAHALAHLERHAEAIDAASAALHSAADTPELLADALCVLSMALAQSQRIDEAIAAAQRAVAVARSAAPPVMELRAVRSLAYVLYSAGRLAESLPVQRDALRLAEALGDQAEAAGAAGNIAALLGVLGDIPASHDHARGARKHYIDMGLSHNSALGCTNLIVLGMAAAYLGAFDEALAALLEAVSLTGDQAVVAIRAKARISLAHLWLTLGCSQAVRPLLHELPTEMMPGMRMQAELLRAGAEEMEGRSGRKHLDRLGRLMAEHADLPLVQSAWVEWSYQGDAQVVVAKLREVRAQCEQLGLPGLARTLRLREVDRLGDSDHARDIDTAARHAAELIPRIADGMSSKTYPPEGWMILSRAMARAGDLRAAAECMERARHWIEQRALPSVPQPHQDSFLRLNPVNRLVLQQRSKEGG